MNKRLLKLFTDSWGGIDDGDILDCYNQTICKGLSCTIKTTIDHSNMYYLCEMRKYTIVASRGRKNSNDRYEQNYESLTCDMTNTITSVYKDNIVMEEQMMEEPIEARPKGKGWKWIPEEKCWIRLRKLTPRECFRLMGVVETDIDKIQSAVFNKNDVIPLRYGVADKEKGERNISNSQQYKMAGNSIVSNCLFEIFRKMFVEKENEQSELKLF